MSIEERPAVVVGNPVRRDALLRSLRSNHNAVILTVWTVLVGAVGAVVLVDQLGLGQPFRAGDGPSETVGAALAQWWIVTLGVGTVVLAVVLAAFGCAAEGERARLRSWSATLIGPWRITMGIWRAQLALILLALVLALPVGGISLALGGTSFRQLGVGLAGAAVGGATASALTIAVACRARTVIAPLVVVLVVAVGVFFGPYAAHVLRDRPAGDPVMAVVPVVGLADAVAPLPAPAVGPGTDCGTPDCDWDTTDPSGAPLDGLRSTVQPWSGRVPPWGWTVLGAVVVTGLALVVTRIRVARPVRH